MGCGRHSGGACCLELYLHRLLRVALNVVKLHHLLDCLGGSLIQLAEYVAVHQAGAEVPDDVVILDAG